MGGWAAAKCNKESSCASEGPRAGGAMLQAGAAVAGAPLKGRLATLEAEVASLEGRVGVLKTEVGAASSGSATEAATVLLERGAEEKSGSLFADYAKLLAS